MGEKINISFLDFLGTEIEIEDEYAREMLADESATRAEDVAVLEARMDTFTTLPAGSTSGDAELMDIRVGADGTTYANAGSAVREQIDNIMPIVQPSKNLIIGTLDGYSLDSNGMIRAQAANKLNVAKVTQGETYTFKTDEGTPIYGFFTTYPEPSGTSYDAQRYIDSTTFTAPITGYVVFRTSANYEYAQIESGNASTSYIAPNWKSAIDKIARADVTKYNETIVGDIVDIDPPTRTSDGYYTTTNHTISQVSGSGYYFAPIDLSEYVGKKVKVSFTSTATLSSRMSAMCDASGNVNQSEQERHIIEAGSVVFEVANGYPYLYISYSATGANLEITVFGGGLVEKSEDIYKTVVYVSSTGSDNNNGDKYAPFKTLQKAIDSGAEIVKAYAGEYAGFTVNEREHPLTVMLAEYPGPYDTSVPDLPKIKIVSGVTSTDYGVVIRKSSSVTLMDLWVDGCDGDCYYILESNVHCIRCYASNNSTAEMMGFRIMKCNGVFDNCKAWNIVKDGFNIHYYGNTIFNDCIAYNCGDDGISHHDGCTGTINGGEFYGCYKGGVASPYGGSIVDVFNVYSHDNTQFGLYAASNIAGGSLRSSGKIADCVFKNNGSYDMQIAAVDVVLWNNIYDTTDIRSTANVTEY